MNIDWIRDLPVDSTTKGMPGGLAPMPQSRVGQMGWNVLRQDLPLPLAVLKREALEGNGAWMRAFTTMAGVMIAPHGKTTMTPELFAMQMADGAFGITCATAGHLEVYRAAGVPRVILANQLVGPANLRMALAHLRDPGFELYCLADSEVGLRALASTAAELGLERPVSVLIEIGAMGARTGVRTIDEGVALARLAVGLPQIRLAGVETYESIFPEAEKSDPERPVMGLLDLAASAAERIAAELPPSSDPFLLTAGGSDFFDLVVERFRKLELGRPVEIVIRSGCYITHDSLHLADCIDRLVARSPEAAALPGRLQPALEVWGAVQSRPEPCRAYVNIGKRDISYDWELPVPTLWFRPGVHDRPQPAPAAWRTLRLNDQHLHLEVPGDDGVQVGDMVAFGISHPCTTFDKWRVIPVVNADYDVVDAFRTFF
jgi:D-serine dehydratase